jgi:hypothetical protein
MITPSFGITATERVLPRLALDFTTAILDNRVSITRADNTATCINSSGVISVVNANLPRFDFDPTTLVCKGLLTEPTRKNLLLNSLIDGSNLATQSVTVSAVSYVLSFYGTGTVDLSGTHTASIVGTGAYPSRRTYIFTPTAGTLTLTVTGTVQFCQLEAGTFVTSFIPTDSTAGGITRNADISLMSSTNFTDWYNQSEGTFLFLFDVSSIVSTNMISISDGTPTAELLQLNTSSGGGVRFSVIDNSAAQASFFSGLNLTVNTQSKCTFAYKENSFAVASNGLATQLDTLGTVPSVSQLRFFQNGNGGIVFAGRAAKLFYWPQRLTNSEVQAFSKL